MNIYDETINDYFEYAKKSILQINQVMNVEDDALVDAKSVVFAGMLAYYGQDFLNDIYLAFLKTEFVLCDEKVDETIGKKYNLNSKQMEFVRKHCPGTFYEVIATKDLATNKCRFKRKIYIDNDLDSDILLRGIVHQMNHVINSIHNPVLKKQGNLGSRMGISFEQFESRKSNEYEVEEAINQLQTDDIMGEIFGFRFYSIEDSSIGNLISSAYLKDEAKKVENDVESENLIIQIIKPLYDHAIFGSSLVDDRINGNLNEIKRSFDSSTEAGCFFTFLRECSMIKPDSEDVENLEHVENAKTLVKRYIDNCNL